MGWAERVRRNRHGIICTARELRTGTYPKVEPPEPVKEERRTLWQRLTRLFR